MGLFDFFDSRKSVARWAAKCFRKVNAQNPNSTDAEIIELALRSRYAVGPRLSAPQQKILLENRASAVDIFTLCYLIADTELLDHLSVHDKATMTWKGLNVVQHTYKVIDGELERLGFS